MTAHLLHRTAAPAPPAAKAPATKRKIPGARLLGPEVQPLWLAASLLIGVVMWFIPAPSGLTAPRLAPVRDLPGDDRGHHRQGRPVGSISVIAMALCAATRVVAPGDPSQAIQNALSGFSNGTIWLIVSAFFAARAVIASGLGQRLAYLFVRVFGRSTLGLAYGLGLADLLTSPAIPSNTARSGYIYPVMKAIAETSGSHTDDPTTHRRIGVYLSLACYNLNLAVSVIFLTGATPNAMAAKLASDLGVHVAWGSWLTATIVPGLVGAILVPLVLYVIYPPELKKTPEAPKMAAEELKKLGRVSRNEWVTLGVFAFMIALWVAGDKLINATTVALLGLGVLLASGALTWEQMKGEKAAWDTLTWFAALVMMGNYLNKLGFIGWFGKQVGGHMHGMNTIVAFAVLTTVYALSHYLFASGTAHAASMFAVFMGVGLSLGLPGVPLLVFLGAIPTLMGCLTHYGNGPAPLYFGAGYVEMGAWWRSGLVLGVMFLLVWLVIGPIWWNVIGVW